jgi:hypothetical protein
MTDHRTLRERVEDHFGPPCDGKSEGICDQCQLRADILEALLAAPAAEPPAPPEPVQDSAAFISNEQDAILGGEEYRDILRRERDEARAEVARLKEELKQAQITLLLGRGRTDELSSLMRLIVSWTEADAYGHRNEDQGGWRERAATARRAAELLQSMLHLRETAEAEAQALRERIQQAFDDAETQIDASHKTGDEADIVGPYGALEIAEAKVLALLSPAQEAP